MEAALFKERNEDWTLIPQYLDFSKQRKLKERRGKIKSTTIVIFTKKWRGFSQWFFCKKSTLRQSFSKLFNTYTTITMISKHWNWLQSGNINPDFLKIFEDYFRHEFSLQLIYGLKSRFFQNICNSPKLLKFKLYWLIFRHHWRFLGAKSTFGLYIMAHLVKS